MDVRALTKYLPAKLRRRIRKGSAKSRILRIVEHYSDARDDAVEAGKDNRSELERLALQVESLINENVSLVYENGELDSIATNMQGELVAKDDELVRMQEVYGAAKGVLYADKKLREMRHAIMYLSLVGPGSKIGNVSQESKKAIAHIINNANINVSLEKIIRDLHGELNKVTMENRVLVKEGFRYKIGDTCKKKDVNKIPAFGYSEGKIEFATSNFERRYGGDNDNLYFMMRKDEVLQAALQKGKNISRIYEVDEGKKIKIVFESSSELRKQGRSFAAASIVPLSHGKKVRKLLSERGGVARNVINKSAEFLYKSGLYFE